MAIRTLLLQGPVGPFFKRLARELSSSGHEVFKINLNGGDSFFYSGAGAEDYTGTRDQWAGFLESRLRTLTIDRIYLFGDCRYYHLVARTVAERLKIEVFVFEEGYLRPDYVTLEMGGVNGHSSVPKIANHYRSVERVAHSIPALGKPGRFLYVASYAMIYYIACVVSAKRFAFYQHHRPLNVLSEGSKWVLSAWRKIKYTVIEKYRFRRILTNGKKPFFLVPLQVHTDMQVQIHSCYEDISDFIRCAVSSFADGADDQTDILFKHHPLDRGYRDYTRYLRALEKEFKLEGRVIYVHDCHLPTLLKNCRGVVTINSTVGLSALHHGKPVKVLGKAIYDIPGLTSQRSLDEFWKTPGEVNGEVYQGFRAWLLRNNQLGGSFYWRAPGRKTPTGLLWPDRVADLHGLPLSGVEDQPIDLTANSTL